MEKATVVVETAPGSLRGVEEDGMRVFRGVPFAEPPVGERRFQPPTPIQPWRGERDALRPGPIAPQLASRLNLPMGDFEAGQDEDCLTLNVWAPETATPDRPCPVLVFIHGGGFSSGAGSLPWYAGDAFARRHGLVVVTVNYRLGVLGWLRAPGLSSGNMGLQDQIAALQWVQDNIAAFGGDADNVTVSGQSAGGMSIALMMTMETCAGLFRRAIVQSAPLGKPMMDAGEAEGLAGELLEIMGQDATQVEALRDAPAADLLDAARTLGMSKTRFGRVATPIYPVIDGELVVAHPMDAARDGKLWTAEFIVGTTREEMMAFFRFDPAFEAATDEQVDDYFADRFGEAADAQLGEARRRRPGGSAAWIVSDAESALTFDTASVGLAETAAAKGRKAFVYRFDWQSPLSGLGSCHCLELPFLLGTSEAWADSPMMADADPQTVAGMRESMQAAWAAFARSGDPSNDLLPDWPAYDKNKRATMCFDTLTDVVSDAAGPARRQMRRA